MDAADAFKDYMLGAPNIGPVTKSIGMPWIVTPIAIELVTNAVSQYWNVSIAYSDGTIENRYLHTTGYGMHTFGATDDCLSMSIGGGCDLRILNLRWIEDTKASLDLCIYQAGADYDCVQISSRGL